jgi:hypothetical protein
VLFGASWLVWGGVFALPWIEAESSVKVAAGGGLWGLSYLFFGGSMVLLGREAWDRMKGALRSRLGWGAGTSGPGPGSGSA